MAQCAAVLFLCEDGAGNFLAGGANFWQERQRFFPAKRATWALQKLISGVVTGSEQLEGEMKLVRVMGLYPRFGTAVGPRGS